MTITRFLVAKYVADIRRMEPKNIGVIGWREGSLNASFAGEMSGVLKPPKLVGVGHRQGYMAAVQSWRLQLNKPYLPMPKGQDDALRGSPEFLEALKLYSNRHFVIGEGGHVQTEASRGLSSVVDELFTQLVDDSDGLDYRHKSALVQSCDDLLEPLSGNERFHRNVEVPCSRLETDFQFTYAYGDDHERPEVLMQAVTLTDGDQVNATAMKFRCLVEDEGIISSDQCACFVGDSPNTDKNRRRLSMLEKFSTIVPVSDPNVATRLLKRMGLPLLQVGS